MRRNCICMALTIILAISAIANADEGKWVSLFDGKTIEGWTREGGYATYEAKDGKIVGTTADGSRNTFLCKGPFSDFILELEVLCDRELNSGVQVRSHVRDSGEVTYTSFGVGVSDGQDKTTFFSILVFGKYGETVAE